MANQRDAAHQNSPAQIIGDGVSILIGTLAGAVGGVLLGALIAWTVAPGWSVTSAIIVFHVTLAMIAMGAWTAPSLLSDPEIEAGPQSPAAVEASNFSG